MANHLKMADISRIHVLSDLGWSKSRIARALGIHRETVARYVKLGKSKPTDAPPGSGDSRAGPGGGQPSRCEPFREEILTKVEAGLTAQRIYQDLFSAADSTVSYHSVRRFVRRLSGGRTLPFRRMECGSRRRSPDRLRSRRANRSA